jgi:hypothetical protein
MQPSLYLQKLQEVDHKTMKSSTYLKESQVQKMSPQQYEKMSDEIMEAIRSGKFIYDVSGSAR